MKTKLAATVIALMLAPGLAMAGCGQGQHASSCKDGYKWDQTKGECVLNPST